MIIVLSAVLTKESTKAFKKLQSKPTIQQTRERKQLNTCSFLFLLATRSLLEFIIPADRKPVAWT